MTRGVGEGEFLANEKDFLASDLVDLCSFLADNFLQSVLESGVLQVLHWVDVVVGDVLADGQRSLKRRRRVSVIMAGGGGVEGHTNTYYRSLTSLASLVSVSVSVSRGILKGEKVGKNFVVMVL